MSLGLGLGLSIRPVSTAKRSGPIYSYYVDSTVVSSGDGTIGSPFKDLTDLPTLVANDSIGLKYGSTWTEQSIDTAEDGITIAAYGTASDGLPLIDGNSVETYCINLTGDNCTVQNIHCARAVDNNGCIVVNNGTIDGCIAEEGGLHTLLIGQGTLSNTIIRNGTGSSLVEVFTTVNGAEITVSNCQLYMDVYDSGMAGLDFHTSGGGVTYAQVTVTGCTFTGLGSGISGGDCDNRILTDNTTDGCLVAYTISGNATVTNPTDINGVSTGVFMSINQPNCIVVLDGGTICRSDFNTSMITSSQTGLDFTAKGNLKIGANTFSVFTIFFFDHGTFRLGEVGDDIELDVRNSGGGIPYLGILGRGSAVTFTTPANYTLTSDTFSLELNGTTKSNLTDIQNWNGPSDGYLENATVGTVTACA